MTWDYRVIRREHEKTGEVFLGVYEVFHDEAGRIFACTEEPVAPCGETLDDLADDLEMMTAALRQPVLNFEDIPEEGAVNPMDEIDFENITTDGGEGWRELKKSVRVTDQAFDELVAGVKYGNQRLLDNVGITISYAESCPSWPLRHALSRVMFGGGMVSRFWCLSIRPWLMPKWQAQVEAAWERAGDITRAEMLNAVLEG